MTADAADRRRGATEFDRNFVVVAGAGTGKTSLLVERAINLVLSGVMPVDRIQAVTFTRKAAGELRVRLAEGLSAVLTATSPAKPVAPKPNSEAARSLARLRERGVEPAAVHERARVALEHLDAAAVGTIHGFAADILRRNPVDAKLPPDFLPDEGEARRLLFEEEWPAFLAKTLAGDSKTRELWLGILDEFSQTEVEAIARSLIESPVSMDFLERHGYASLDPREYFAGTIADLRARIEAGLPQVKPDEHLHLMLATELRLFHAFATSGAAGVVRFPEADIQPASFWGATKGFRPRSLKDEALKQSLIETAVEALRLLKQLNKLEYRNLDALMRGLQSFATRFRKASARVGAPAFDDLLLRARNLLRDVPSVRERESGRFGTLLLDEFQDTDPLQYEIVFLLAAPPGTANITDAYGLDLKPGRLFIVGDPKQSIYRFRGADMAAYHRAVTHVLATGGEQLHLTHNFRSVEEILDPLNDLFQDWFADGGPRIQPEYEAIHSEITAGEPRIEVWSVPVEPGGSAEDRREAEARVLAAGLRSLHDEKGYGYGDMAVLFRAMTQVSIYTRALREAGIDYVADGAKAFSSRPEVVEALALLRALANPADPVGFLGVLRSTLGGAADAELARFGRDGKGWYWRGRDPADLETDYPAVASAIARLNALERSTRRLPADRRILELLTEGDFPVLMAAYFEGAQRVANVRKLAYRAAELARDRLLSLDETVQALEMELVGQYNEGESPLADEAVDAVRILSVHAAKGLEFPLVVLADLRQEWRQGWKPPQARVHLVDDRLQLGVRTGNRGDLVMQLGDEEATRHETAESKRLSYVAATRAKDRLVILNSTPRRLPIWVEAMRDQWGYALRADDPHAPFPEDPLLAGGCVIHSIRRPAPPPPLPERAALPDLVSAVHLRDSVAAAIPTPNAFPFRTPSSDHQAERSEHAIVDTDRVTAPPPELAKLAGTAVHRLLEGWDFLDPGDLPRRLESVADSFTQEAFSPAEILAEAGIILTAFLATDLPARLGRVDVLGKEVPILFRDAEGLTVHGYVDLVYRLDGRVHVADYKTDVVKNATAQAAGYAGQLTDYGEALTRAMRLDAPPVLEILFLRTGDRIELEPVRSLAPA